MTVEDYQEKFHAMLVEAVHELTDDDYEKLVEFLHWQADTDPESDAYDDYDEDEDEGEEEDS